MYRLWLAIGVLVASCACNGVAGAQQVSVTITSIKENVSIEGRVTGLPAGQNGAYKVLVLVHTDVWYAHPYARQGEGLSSALITPDGTWTIPTVKRQFRADQIAALVVTRNAPEVDKIDNILAVPAEGRVVQTLTGTDDFGKL